MDHGEIRRLVGLMEELGLAEYEFEDENSRIRLVRAVVGAAGRDQFQPEPTTGDSTGIATSEAAQDVPPGLAAVLSPMVGTFYRGAAPDAPPFVSPGEVVEPGRVLCLIEAMKTMNEIAAEAAGRIVSVRAENGAPVEYGTILFLVEPIA
ncbi:MAG: hypothetical protein RL698_1309 [Pseudomonadota bacterium]